MKHRYFRYIVPAVALAFATASCNDFLDLEPPSYVVPEDYYQTEDQVQAAVNQFYNDDDILPSHDTWGYGTFITDTDTDNQASQSANSKYATGLWLVGLTNDDWDWTKIRQVNYTLNTVLGYYNEGGISGSDTNIRHYIGELYFFRAFCYFKMLQLWGDLPILEEALPDDEATLVENCRRSPRNEVSRFILSDLDNAISYMATDIDSRHNRVSADVATLFRSRVALYEGSWLTYFKGTPFVPLGDGWPGAAKDYNAGYEYPSGSIDAEIEYFLTEAASSAEEVAEKYKGSLSVNTGLVPQSESDPDNPYFYMFGNTDMSGYSEVLMWREYSEGLGITNNVEVMVNHGNYGVGLTRSMVESFVMEDGLPIYAQHDGFQYCDTAISTIRQHADPRLKIFLKEPGQTNVFKNMDSDKDHYVEIETYPLIWDNTGENGYATGYAMRKGGTFDKALTGNGAGYTGSITFRATEALLNYMEAEYMLTGDINSGRILEYWKAVRTAAGFTGAAADPQTTIAATVMQNETLDWGAYSAGELLTDATLYNIRRERRCELMGEALRWMDLQRWRALDQMIDNYYHVEGFHFWNTPIEGWFVYSGSDILADGSSSANMSAESLSEYYRPYEKNMTSNNSYRNGYTWHMAHYLYPLPIQEFLLTSSDYSSVELSPLYQNPYWPTTTDMPAEQ